MSDDDKQVEQDDRDPIGSSDASRGKAELDAELDDLDVDAPDGADESGDSLAGEVGTSVTDGPASGTITETKYCTECGAEISRNAEICPDCGVRQGPDLGGSSSGEKESGVSAVLSFLLPGVGQLYNGQVGRGAVVFAGWMVWEFVAFLLTTLTLGVFFLIWVPVELFVHVVAAYDAYDQAEKINAGAVVVD